MSDKTIVLLENVYLSTRRATIFSNLNLHLRACQTAVITGGSGAGKTSLAELLIGRMFADSGLVEVCGEVLQSRRHRAINRIRRLTGSAGGIFGLIPTMTVAENITFPLVLTGRSKRARKEKLLKMLTEFSLLNKASVYPRELTRVEQMLVQIARASIASQPLMIIDEPAVGLDKPTSARVFEYLGKTILSGRAMIILTSERPAQELPDCDYYVIKNGSLA